jgi:hypothetical protein
MASGQVYTFEQELASMSPSTQSHKLLGLCHADDAVQLMADFAAAKSRMRLRLAQGFGFWKNIPWSLLALLEPDHCQHFGRERERNAVLTI